MPPFFSFAAPVGWGITPWRPAWTDFPASPGYAVGCNQLVPRQGGGDDKPVGWVAVHGFQQSGPDRGSTIHGQLDQPMPQQVRPPSSYICEKCQASLVMQHGNFPERDRGNRQIIDLSGQVYDLHCPSARSAFINRQPHQDLRIEQDHGLITLSGWTSASHSTSMGSMMSPRIWITSR